MLTHVKSNSILFFILGLHVILNVHQKEYLPELADTAGIRLLVHEKDRMPFPEDEGITVSPGHSTSIGLRKVGHMPTFFVFLILCVYVNVMAIYNMIINIFNNITN